MDPIKINPLTRALRIAKLTLSALESTLLLYLDEKRAIREIPTLRMLSLDMGKLKGRGKRLLRRLSGVPQGGTEFVLKEDISQVGGGAYPVQELPTIVVAIKPLNLSVNGLQEILRRGEPPIISRISKDELILDMRTGFDVEIPLLAAGIKKALAPTANL